MKKQPAPYFSIPPPAGSELIIEALLHRESLAPRTLQVCPECGSVMRNVESTFSLFGTEKTWNLALRMCLTCAPISRLTQPLRIT
jgi:hypothetical protein